jgi:hypothetical protein
LEEELAARIIRGAVSLDKALGELDLIVGSIGDEQERREFAKHLGDLSLDQHAGGTAYEYDYDAPAP